MMVTNRTLGAERARVPNVVGPWSDGRAGPPSLLASARAAYHALMARLVDVRRDDVSAMRDASAVGTPTAPATRTRRWAGPGRMGPRRWPSLRGTSLAARFLIASMAILLVAGVAVGLWVGDLLERSIIEREAAATGLYVESIIGPDVASLAEGSDLTAAEIATLDAHLSSTPLTTVCARSGSGRPTVASSTAPTRASSGGASRWSATSRKPGRARSSPAWTT